MSTTTFFISGSKPVLRSVNFYHFAKRVKRAMDNREIWLTEGNPGGAALSGVARQGWGVSEFAAVRGVGLALIFCQNTGRGWPTHRWGNDPQAPCPIVSTTEPVLKTHCDKASLGGIPKEITVFTKIS